MAASRRCAEGSSWGSTTLERTRSGRIPQTEGCKGEGNLEGGHSQDRSLAWGQGALHASEGTRKRQREAAKEQAEKEGAVARVDQQSQRRRSSLAAAQEHGEVPAMWDGGQHADTVQEALRTSGRTMRESTSRDANMQRRTLWDEGRANPEAFGRKGRESNRAQMANARGKPRMWQMWQLWDEEVQRRRSKGCFKVSAFVDVSSYQHVAKEQPSQMCQMWSQRQTRGKWNLQRYRKASRKMFKRGDRPEEDPQPLQEEDLRSKRKLVGPGAPKRRGNRGTQGARGPNMVTRILRWRLAFVRTP